MKLYSKGFFLILAFLLLAPMSGLTFDVVEHFENKAINNLKGFKGVGFSCLYNKKDKITSKICNRTEKEIKLLASAYNFNLKLFTKDISEYRKYIDEKGYVLMEITLSTTDHKSDFDLKSIYANVAFVRGYDKAIEQGNKTHIWDKIPREGQIELWSNHVIGHGSASEIVIPISDGIEQHIKDGITLFLKAKNK